MRRLIHGEKGLGSLQLLAAMVVAAVLVVLAPASIRDIYAMGGSSEIETANTWAAVSQPTREWECSAQTLISKDVCLQITAGGHAGSKTRANGYARVTWSEAGQVGFILPVEHSLSRP